MNAERYSFDTNIYFYSVDTSAGDKHIRALDMLRNVDVVRTVVLMQTLGELSNSILKKKPSLIDAAEQLIHRLEGVGAVPTAPDDIYMALHAHKLHGFPFWDAMIWATACRAGCNLLITEDFQDGRTLEGVTFRNPFTMSLAELAAVFA